MHMLSLNYLHVEMKLSWDQYAHFVSYLLFLSEGHSVRKMTGNQAIKTSFLFCKVLSFFFSFFFTTADFNYLAYFKCIINY